MQICDIDRDLCTDVKLSCFYWSKSCSLDQWGHDHQVCGAQATRVLLSNQKRDKLNTKTYWNSIQHFTQIGMEVII